ncbi:DUF5420 family protein [Aggregatibacter actinomycetemcomitans]|uniref:DUF5420 family protein n=1 Tax=Aggregatibacter actinomycetemcomitans TaxID=714 RepID=UPI000D691A5D|nr:DUF5420 family protein [Aggregatibacter actinomycetemcomitans]
MRPEFRYFKCPLDVEPIKSLDEQWRKEREQRNKQLNPIFDTIPFYEYWRGDETSIFCIVSSINNPEFEKIKDDKTYKFEMLKNEKVVITGNKRTKAGKAFNTKIQQIRDVLNNYLPFNEFMLNKLKLTCWVFGQLKAYLSVCGVASDHFILSIPVKSGELGGQEFPTIPDYLVEIKQSEFLMMQGK